MPITYTNRKGDTYHLFHRQDKNGRMQYFFSKKEQQGVAVDAIPGGYEIFEHPSGQVFLRRKITSEVPDGDYRTIEQYMNEHFGDEQYILERKQKEIVIHFADEEPEDLLSAMKKFGVFAQADLDKLVKIQRRYLRYSPMMRISYDSKSATYTLERYCYLGGIDDWVLLDGSASIKKLAEKYCKHLGKDSFFHLR